jgi:uncharacterized membrane protein YuzA (DUF378 family)
VFSLILFIVFAIAFGYFATFNLDLIEVVLGPYYTTPPIPLYIVIGMTLLIGLLLAWFISLANSLTNGFALRQKERELNNKDETIVTLTKKVNELQLENAKLSGDQGNDPTDELAL